MWETYDEMRTASLALMQKALGYCYYSVSSQLQNTRIAELKTLNLQVESYRLEARKQQDEAAANSAFIMQRYINGVSSTLQMWILLKANDLVSAWEKLIDAQESVGCGIRLGEIDGFNSLVNRLSAIEKLLFPPQLFVSSAIQVSSTECSICGSEYGECDHLAMRLYMGEMCRKIVREVSHIDHVAIVQEPDDKRLRVPYDVSSLTLVQESTSAKNNGHERRGRGKPKTKAKRKRR